MSSTRKVLKNLQIAHIPSLGETHVCSSDMPRDAHLAYLLYGKAKDRQERSGLQGDARRSILAHSSAPTIGATEIKKREFSELALVPSSRGLDIGPLYPL